MSPMRITEHPLTLPMFTISLSLKLISAGLPAPSITIMSKVEPVYCKPLLLPIALASFYDILMQS